jgi:hypothetical protein
MEPLVIPIPKNIKYFEPYTPDMNLIERAFGPNGDVNRVMTSALNQKKIAEFQEFVFREEFISHILEKYPKELFMVPENL